MKIYRLLSDKKVVLASSSPRRKELMKNICSNFTIIPATEEEIVTLGTKPEFSAEFLAVQKCKEVSEKSDADVIIACDTIVLFDRQILGKPKNPFQAAVMLSALSGKTHEVISGTAFYYAGEIHSFSVTTKVTFRNLTEEDIADYIATGEPFDKAGGYGIQGLGSLLVDKIDGDYFNVVGLPVSKLAMILGTFLEQD